MVLKSKTALLTALLTGAGIYLLGGFYAVVPSFAQQPTQEPTSAAEADLNTATMAEPDCPFFGIERERFLLRSRKLASGAGNLTRQFYARGGNRAQTPRTGSFDLSKSGRGGVVDGPIWAALQAANITPAQQTTDYEFVRRVSLDVTGRIPSADRVAQFVVSTDPNKRPAYIDELLATSAYVDKWTMFFGDLYKNTANTVSVRIQPEGRNAFYKWIHDSIAANKPYNQMASEVIAAKGNNNFDQTNGQVNFLVLGVVTGGPAQDIMDQQTANVATTFLGMSNLNCLLCHNGKGHLDSLNLWGSKTTRVQAWGMAAFMAHTWPRSLPLPVDPAATNPARYNYWSLDKYTADYNLNTTAGNRPARQPIGTVKSIAPSFIFGNGAAAKGEDYRDALARYVTADPQFARAAVNYIWAHLFGRGIVDPPDQFDPLRLDPNNPPPAPWTLQPSNPDLLNGLAQQFISSGYNVKALIRTIVNSDTYQLSSAYGDTWDDSWEPYFARKLVRRLWSEEVHDAVVTAINTLPLYTVPNFSNDSTVYDANSPGFGKISFAMQAPDVVNMPDGGGAASQFMDNFLRGNRDDAPRKSEGSVLQALALMNDPFVVNRIHATGNGAAASFLQQLLTGYTDSQLVNVLYAKVLSRPPSGSETQTALAALSKGGSTARKANAEDVLWTLFNKLDFVFNY